MMCRANEHFTNALRKGQATVITSSEQRDELVREFTGDRVSYDADMQRYRSGFNGSFMSMKDVVQVGKDALMLGEITQGTYSFIVRSL